MLKNLLAALSANTSTIATLKNCSVNADQTDKANECLKYALIIKRMLEKQICDLLNPFPEVNPAYDSFRFFVDGNAICDISDQTEAESKWCELTLTGANFSMRILYDEIAGGANHINDKIYNCRKDCKEPDWTQYDALELGGCIDEDGETHGGINRHEAEFFTVYGHFKNGGCDAITDIRAFNNGFERACEIAEFLSHKSGLPLNIVC